MLAVIGSHFIPGPTATPDTTQWHQCPDMTWTSGTSVDTRDYVSGSGPLPLTLAASNAAGVSSAPSETLNVDNDPVGVSLNAPNDPNPTVWVNHDVTLQATASAGPSGVGGIDCSVDRGTSRTYQPAGVAVSGDGAHAVSCSAWNNAVGPQGQPNTASSSMGVKIDEAPPAVALEPANPADPTQVVADVGDNESGVSGGSVEIAPAGTNSWTSLATSSDGRHLFAAVNDARLRGAYTIRATSCDTVGNCASTDENVALPLRLAASSDVSLEKIQTPARVVRKRVLVGFHLKTERRHRRVVKVKVGGHYRVVRLVIHANTRCAQRRVRVAPRRWRVITVCRKMKLHLVSSKRVAYGRPATVHGLLLTSAGVPIANAPVSILTAPDNGLQQFAPVATATSDNTGAWTVKLPPGPSRLLRAVYGGSATLLPAQGQATIEVPAKIKLSVSPRTLPWTGTVMLRGQLLGGYVPPDGVALRLLIKLPGRSQPYEPVPFRTNAAGGFVIPWSWGRGNGVSSYPFAVATTATESDYPFTASRSRWIRVTFGLPTPRTAARHHAARHRQHHKRRR